MARASDFKGEPTKSTNIDLPEARPQASTPIMGTMRFAHSMVANRWLLFDELAVRFNHELVGNHRGCKFGSHAEIGAF